MTAAATPGREELRGQIAQALCCQGDCIRGEDACWKYTTSGHKKITDAIVAIFDRLAAKPADEGWQDISTAPENHLPVLAYGPYGQIVAFRDVTWAWWPIPAVNPLGYKLTHWRPLLAPPSTTREPKR